MQDLSIHLKINYRANVVNKTKAFGIPHDGKPLIEQTTIITGKSPKSNLYPMCRRKKEKVFYN